MAQIIPRSITIGKKSGLPFYLSRFDSCIFVYSDFAVRSNLIDRIKSKIKSDNFTDINISQSVNSFDDLFNILHKLSKRSFDTVISIGGGTVIDIAKLVCYVLNSQIKLKEFPLNYSNNLPEIKEYGIKHFSIITMPGSGAESSKVCVINMEDKKYFYISDFLVPDHVIYDHISIKQVDKKRQIFQITDALTHAVESIMSPLSSELSKEYSLSTINIVHSLLRSYFESNTQESGFLKNIDKFSLASFYGGASQSNAGTGLAHALAHSIEQNLSLTHSEAISFTSVIAYKHNKLLKDNIYLKKLKDDSIVNKIDFCYLNLDVYNKKSSEKIKSIINKNKIGNTIVKEAQNDICWRLNVLKPDSDLVLSLINKINE